MDCESEKIIPDFIDEDCSKHDWIKVDEGELEKNCKKGKTAMLWQLCYGSYDLCCGSQHKDRIVLSENSSADINLSVSFVLIFRFVIMQIVILYY